MKKITFTLLLGFFVAFSFAQTIVSTVQENKKAILEEYTGVQCTYCPLGHSIANTIKSSHPDDAFIINIHTGGYASPGTSSNYLDFRTNVGDVITSESGLTGYPSGSINRHIFSGTASAMDRGAWSAAVNQVLGESSYVNIAVEADVDNASRLITVHVEAYYTGDSPVSSNFINVALVQNNTNAPQLNQGTVEPNYNHMHRLIKMVTGDWGDEVITTTTGTFVDKTFVISVPVDINYVPVNLDELEVVAFIAETHQEVITANGATVTKTNTPLYQNDVSLSKIYSIKKNCSGTFIPKIKVSSLGSNIVTSLNIEYAVNGEATQNYEWNGSLTSLTSTDIELPETTFTLQDDNTFTAIITTPDVQADNNEIDDREFSKAPETTEDLIVHIYTDNWGYELTWNIKNSSDVIVASGGGDGTNGSAGSYANGTWDTGGIQETYNLPADCYTLEVNDSYGDGGNAVAIRNSNSELIDYIGGSYGAGDFLYFTTSNPANVNDLVFSDVVIYPNPSDGNVIFIEAKDLDIEIYNILGKKVFNTTILSGTQNVDLSNLSSGIYLVNITDGSKKGVRKLIIK